MKIVKFTVSLILLTIFSKSTNACNGVPGSVDRIVCLADSLKATLTAAQISTLQLPFTYTNSQTWSNLPTSMQPRLGIKIGTLNAAQLAIAKAIVKEVSGNTANEGYDEANQLLLADAFLSANGGGTGYGEGLYYLCFNGTPTLTGAFSIKFGGHHLQIENTYNNNVMVGATPHFEAIEPLTFTSGGNTYSTITQEKNALAAMFSTLSATQLASAQLSTTFSDIIMGAKNNGSYKDWTFPATKVGLKVGLLSSAQKALVFDAIKTYVLDIDSINSEAILNQYQNELDNTYIAFSGNSALTTQNNYARIDGPGVWIEFTVQGGIIMSGVHYHSIWRDHTRDYGGQGSTAGLQSTSVGASSTSTSTINKLDNAKVNFSFFPNPTRDFVTINLSVSKPSNITIDVIDVAGKVVKQIVHNNMHGEQSIVADISSLQSGIYIMRMLADDKRTSYKIIKE